jgi:hypothetical protein
MHHDVDCLRNIHPLLSVHVVTGAMEICVNGRAGAAGVPSDCRIGSIATCAARVSYRLELAFLLITPRADWDFLAAFPPANSAFSVLLARCFVLSFFLASLVS